MADKPPFFWIILFAVAVVVIAGVAFYVGLNTSGNNTTKGIGNDFSRSMP
jgi:flagellar basal body-associated protein FliL